MLPVVLSGNDDAGQMSAWYVFSAMGFYPVCPGTPYYIIGSPSFPRMSIRLENGKTFTILAHNANEKNVYIQSARLNGKEYDKNYFTHQDIVQGGTLEFQMGPNPNTNWGASALSLPPDNNEINVQKIKKHTHMKNQTIISLLCCLLLFVDRMQHSPSRETRTTS